MTSRPTILGVGLGAYARLLRTGEDPVRVIDVETAAEARTVLSGTTVDCAVVNAVAAEITPDGIVPSPADGDSETDAKTVHDPSANAAVPGGRTLGEVVETVADEAAVPTVLLSSDEVPGHSLPGAVLGTVASPVASADDSSVLACHADDVTGTDSVGVVNGVDGADSVAVEAFRSRVRGAIDRDTEAPTAPGSDVSGTHEETGSEHSSVPTASSHENGGHPSTAPDIDDPARESAVDLHEDLLPWGSVVDSESGTDPDARRVPFAAQPLPKDRTEGQREVRSEARSQDSGQDRGEWPKAAPERAVGPSEGLEEPAAADGSPDELVTDLLEARRSRLAGLNALGRRLLELEEPEPIYETAVEVAADDLELRSTAVLSFDGSETVLRTRARTGVLAEVPASALDGESGPGWDAFVEGDETATRVDVGDEEGIDEVGDLVAVRLAHHGVLMAATRDEDGFGTGTMELLEAVGSALASALERADRERQLRERERDLERRNETLERLDEINDVIRNIDQSLVAATTRADIEQAVCRHLATTGPYDLAWIGSVNRVTDEVEVDTSAGADDGYTDAISVSVDDGLTGDGPAARAVSALEPQIVDDTAAARSFEPWRREALDRGYRSLVALPLVYEGTRYGVLVVYADEPEAFADLARDVLTELSSTVAHAINVVETKRGLEDSTVTELSFLVGGHSLSGFVETVDCEASLRGTVAAADGTHRGYFTVRGADAAEVLDEKQAFPGTTVRVSSEYVIDGVPACLVEVDLDATSFCSRVADHGGVVESLDVTPDGAETTVSISGTASVREFVASVERWVPDARLTAKRDRDRSLRTTDDFWAAVTDALTTRQREVLETAYLGGYFNAPRDRTASEIAESLGIAQPTYTAHLRAGQRKLFELLFERGRQPASAD